MEKEGQKIHDGVSPEEIAGGFKNDLMSVLDGKQYSDIIAKGVACGVGLGNITIFDVLDTLGTVLQNNLMAFIAQMCHVYQVYQKKGLSDETCDAQGYGKINQFVTDKRMNTIFCRFRSHYTTKQWNSIYKNFKTIFLLDNYPCCVPSSSG